MPVYQMDTLENRDRVLEMMWDDLADVPFDEDDHGEMVFAEDWMCFKKGETRMSCWEWFDERHSKGVAYLLYGYQKSKMMDMAELSYCRALCFECDSELCIFNPEGICRYPMVYGKKPKLDEQGCYDCSAYFEEKEARHDKSLLF